MLPVVQPGVFELGEGRRRFTVWAPTAQRMALHLYDVHEPQERTLPMEPVGQGYYRVDAEAAPGTRYRYRIDGTRERPDPASRYQPKGVHGPSQVIEDHFAWSDAAWRGLPLPEYVIYELHVGAFTPEGTFDAIIQHLPYLRELGVTAVEIMPVAQFPGTRNWGYDGVYPFAVQDSYGGPHALRRLVDACHRAGLAVILDVVYNHLGAEGNYLWDYGPYFTDRYKTGWGSAVNFDGPGSDEVRTYFLSNALYWLCDYHVDALRLDAVHAILDFSTRTFLEELAAAVAGIRHTYGRLVYLIAESDLNNPRLLRSPEVGGYSLDAQWSDDFHHALHTLLTGESGGYYRDFVTADGPSVALLGKALREAFIYTGQPSAHRGRRHGMPARDVPAYRFVVAAQNHDQIGNRMLGERLGHLVSFERLKLAAGALLLSPFIPLLFMGEEYAEHAPFQYFVDHGDPDLIEAVRRGRREEFAAFTWQGEPPDPAAEATFTRSKLHLTARGHGDHATLLAFYRELLRLRRTVPALRRLSTEDLVLWAFARQDILCVHRWADADHALVIYHFGTTPAEVTLQLPAGRWIKAFDASDPAWQCESNRDRGEPPPEGRLPAASPVIISEGEVRLTPAPLSFALYRKQEADDASNP